MKSCDPFCFSRLTRCLCLVGLVAGFTPGVTAAPQALEVDVFDPDYSDVTAVSDQVELALGRWTDLAADPVVHDVKLMDSARYYEDDIELERKRFDFLFIITV